METPNYDYLAKAFEAGLTDQEILLENRFTKYPYQVLKKKTLRGLIDKNRTAKFKTIKQTDLLKQYWIGEMHEEVDGLRNELGVCL